MIEAKILNPNTLELQKKKHLHIIFGSDSKLEIRVCEEGKVTNSCV